MLSYLSSYKTVVSHIIASGQFGTRALGCTTCLHITETAVNRVTLRNEVIMPLALGRDSEQFLRT